MMVVKLLADGLMVLESRESQFAMVAKQARIKIRKDRRSEDFETVRAYHEIL